MPEVLVESNRPILRWVLLGLLVFTVVLVVVGNLYRTPLRTVNLLNETTETITVWTVLDGRTRVFSAPAGQRAVIELADQSDECSEQTFTISTPSQLRGELTGRFCQDENHPVRPDDLS